MSTAILRLHIQNASQAVTWPWSRRTGGQERRGNYAQAFPFSRGSSQLSDRTQVDCRWILYQLSHKGSPRILEWVAYPFSSGSSQPRNQTGFSCIAGGFFTNYAMRKAPYVCVCVCVCVYIYITFVCVYVYMCICIYVWVCIYIYTPHLLNLFISQWTFRFFPCLGCCQ